MPNLFSTPVDISNLVGTVPTSVALFEFDKLGPTPITVMLPDHTAGQPNIRKKYRKVLFHGEGTAWVRVFVDGSLAIETQVDLVDSVTTPRIVGIPRGTNGYAIRIELTGICNIRTITYVYEPMEGKLET